MRGICVNEKKKIIGMISLEMIAFFSKEKILFYSVMGMKVLYSLHGDWLAFVDGIASAYMKTEMHCVRALSPSFFSMHYTERGLNFSGHHGYWANGIRAVMLTNTPFYRNMNYHRGGDTSEVLDYARMKNIILMCIKRYCRSMDISK